uniref:Uncharacterized protein n=1 Tax=Anguilla anguilla TaxID=7936 RepID=A0A0E9U9K4_ANGAN
MIQMILIGKDSLTCWHITILHILL